MQWSRRRSPATSIGVVTRTLVHLSDLHFGRNQRLEQRCAALVRTLVDADVDHVVVTGDVTERGLVSEFERFQVAFAELAESGRLSVVPGNHDRLGDDAGDLAMAGRRVAVIRRPGLHLVLCDSTRPENGRFAFFAHGEIDERDLDGIDAAVDDARPGDVVAVLLHHHVLPMPHESALEALAGAIGLPFGDALVRGPELLARLRGRCDLVLHGHRHVPCESVLYAGDARPLWLGNAGCSPALGRARVFTHARGRLVEAPRWLTTRERTSRAA
jgi:3',5'-cyclic AMP phosphodiesterase CpdA